MRSRPLAAAALATTAVVLCLWIEFTHRANGDTAWFLYLSRQALRGLRPYGDYVEINPPLIVWLGLPSAWLAEWTGLPITRLYAVSVAGLILGSVIWWHRLYRRLFDERASTLTPISI